MRRIAGLIFLFFFLGSFPSTAQHVPFRKGDQWYLYNKTTRTTSTETYQAIVPSTGNILFIQQDGKWGAIDGKNQPIVPVRYAEVKQLNREVIFAREAKGIQLFDTLGKPITKTLFTEAAAYVSNPLFIVVRDEKKKYGIIDSHGKILLDFIYDFAPEHPGEGYLIVGQKNKLGEKEVGLRDSLFRPVLPVKYSKISILEKQYFSCHEGNRYVLFDMQSKEVYRGEGEPVKTYTNFILIRDENRYGVYARKAKKSFLFTGGFYYRVWDEQGLAAFNDHDDARTYFVTAAGDSSSIKGYRVLMHESYTSGFAFTRGGEDDNKPQKYGMIDRTGKILLPMQYDMIQSWNSVHCAVGTYKLNAKGQREIVYSLIEIVTGREVLPRTYEGIELFPLGGIALKDNGTWRLYNANMELQDSREYTQVVMGRGVQLFPEIPGRTLYQVQAKVNDEATRIFCLGFIDGTCRVVIPPVYHEIKLIRDQYNNPAPFCRLYGTVYDATLPFPARGRGVLLDCNGNRLGGGRYTTVGAYSMGNFIPVYNTVQYEDEWRGLQGLIDTLGNLVVSPEYDEIRSIPNGTGFQMTRNGRSTYADASAKPLTPILFDYIAPLGGQLFWATLNRRKGVIDANGKPLTAFAYDEIRSEPLLNRTLFKVERAKKEFYVDIDGTEYYTP